MFKVMFRSTDIFIYKVAAAASFLLPATIAVLFASPTVYWLDSPEFTAAVQTLGIPHPPGHPLYIMLVKPFTLLPIGSIAFRVSVASALFGAIASYLLFKLTFAIISKATPSATGGINAILSFVVAILTATSPGWLFQCVRAEVYSLQIMLVIGAIYPLTLFSLRGEDRDDRLLYLSAFIFGLGLTNHHFIMLAALPASIPALVMLTKNRGGAGAAKTSVKMGLIALSGLLPYLFIPLRSAAGAPISLGAIRTVADFFWVVSAKVYQKSMAKEHVVSLDDRTVDAIMTLMGELGPVLVIAALGGIYMLLRNPNTRMSGVILFLLGTVTLLLRAIMGFDPFNPDYYGYMLPAITALSIAAAVFAAISIDVLRFAFPNMRAIPWILSTALIILPASKLDVAKNKADLSSFRATRLFYNMTMKDVEPNALVLTSYYKLFFILWSAKYIDGSRPDVTVINPQLFGYPGYLAAVIKERPDLKKLARSMVVNGKITEATVADLAMRMPLRVEPSPWIEDKAAEHLIPAGPVYQAVPEPLGKSDIIAGAKTSEARWQRFYQLLGPKWKDHETWRMLSWSHYLDAIFLARRGAIKAADKAVNHAETLGNHTPQIQGLRKAIDAGKSGPIDVTKFLIN